LAPLFFLHYGAVKFCAYNLSAKLMTPLTYIMVSLAKQPLPIGDLYTSP